MNRHEAMLVEREEVALREVGQTRIQPRLAWTLTLFFLVTITAVPVAQHMADVRASLNKQRPSPMPQAYEIFSSAARVPTHFVQAKGGLWARMKSANAIFLRDIQQYEQTLEDSSVPGKYILPPTQWFLTKHLGLGNEQVYLGRDQWLFYRPDIDYLTAPGFLEPRALRPGLSANKPASTRHRDPRPAILEFHRQLAARGIELILLPTPVKSAAHPEMFSTERTGKPESLQNSSYARLIAELEKHGVKVFDMEKVYAQLRASGRTNLYLATDTHWRPETAQAVAHNLARFLQSQSNFPSVGTQKLIAETVSVTELGDVAAMLRLPAEQKLYRPETVTVRQVLTESGELWKASRMAEVLVLGDSFCNIYSMAGLKWGESAGLTEQLAYELGRPLDAILRNDDGAFATRQMLGEELARGRDRLTGKRFVIWQFAMRELVSGDWKPLPLELRAPSPSGLLALQDGKSVTVSGIVSEISSVPKPGKAPYREHIVSVHLVDLEATDNSPLRQREGVVYVWSMRDNRWTDAARWRPGQRVKLRLVPWRERESQLGRINRSELEDERFLLADAHWGEVL